MFPTPWNSAEKVGTSPAFLRLATDGLRTDQASIAMVAATATDPPMRILGNLSILAARRTVTNMGKKKTRPSPKSKSMKTRRTPRGITRTPNAWICPLLPPLSRRR